MYTDILYSFPKLCSHVCLGLDYSISSHILMYKAIFKICLTDQYGPNK